MNMRVHAMYTEQLLPSSCADYLIVMYTAAKITHDKMFSDSNNRKKASPGAPNARAQCGLIRAHYWKCKTDFRSKLRNNKLTDLFKRHQRRESTVAAKLNIIQRNLSCDKVTSERLSETTDVRLGQVLLSQVQQMCLEKQQRGSELLTRRSEQLMTKCRL
ncbi:hypothetical protein F2P81_023277 [Scophthalmus maximus]|uniref:Uncharacterized protein n=1 Tax=Scophthalmus maximus TaxID=52904 RepID=A0A6A4RWA0_SCOMX|nr:hypothetical protein F2P81_023277 [Scophthalmus maximus]